MVVIVPLRGSRINWIAELGVGSLIDGRLQEFGLPDDQRLMAS